MNIRYGIKLSLALIAVMSLSFGQTVSGEVGSKQSYSGPTQWYEVIETGWFQSVVQTLYLSDELDSAGVDSNGVIIKGIQFKVAQVPGMDMNDFRVAYGHTSENQLTNWDKGLNVVYGPVNVAKANLAVDTWEQFDFSTTPIWNGSDNVIIEFSFSNNNYISGGGLWSWNTNIGNRSLRWKNDTGFSYPYYDQNIGFTTEPWIPNIKLIYEIPAVYPVQNIIAIAGYKKVDLEWSMSKTASVDQYLIYRGASEETLTLLDSTTNDIDTTYSDTGLINGNTYFYGVKAIKGTDTSYVSNIVSATPEYNGPVWWVDKSHNGPEYDGSESSPLLTFSAALDEAKNGDTIRIKPGTYIGSSHRNIDFSTKGFNGQGLTSLVIESSGVDSVIFDAEEVNRHFIFNDSSIDTNSFVIDGIHFINGFKSVEHGGSMFITGQASPTFKNCSFVNNSVIGSNRSGGAIFVEQNGSSPRFINCRFVENYATYSGGAVEIQWSADPTFEGTEFLYNGVLGEPGNGVYGGAINIESGSPTFYDCAFDTNFAGDPDATSIEWNESRGGAVNIFSNNTLKENPVIFQNTFFRGNTATAGNNWSFGGAISARSQVELTNCVVSGNLSLIGSTNNYWSNAVGGGLYINTDSWNPFGGYAEGDSTIIINNTIVDNEAYSESNADASRGGGIYVEGMPATGQKIFIYNSIIFDNEAAQGRNHSKDINSNALIWADYNNIEDKELWRTNFSDFDYSYEYVPGFVSDDGDNYALLNASPLIGLGSKTPRSGFTAPSIDIVGNARPAIGPDIGAFENANSSRVGPMYIDDLEVTAVYNETVELAWTAVANVDSYKVYIGTIEGFSNIEADSTFNVSGATTSVIVSGLTNLTHYYFFVTALDVNDNESLNSDEVTGTPYGPWFVGKTNALDDPSYGTESLPFATLKYAITQAMPGDTIFILPGTYTTSGFRNLSTTDLKNGVVIKSTNGPEETIFQSNGFVRHMTFDSGQDTSFKVIGITFSNGRAQIDAGQGWDPNNNGIGGSILVKNASPYFENCVFRSNVSTAGGGAVAVADMNGRPYFNDCRFVNNTLEQVQDWWAYGGRYGGGAAFITNNGSAIFAWCEFDSNSVIDNGFEHDGYGGAVLIDDMDYVNNTVYRTRLVTSSFKNNKVNVKWYAQGGAVHAESPALISNSVFANNKAVSLNNQNNDGAAIGVSIFPRNNGGVDTFEPLVVRNSTIVNNENGGIWIDNGENWRTTNGLHLVMFNSIIWGNGGAGIWDYDPGYGSVRASNNNIQNASWLETVPWFHDNPNVSLYPLFNNYSGGDFTLSDRSYMIGGGIASFEGWPAPNVDITGKMRPTPTGSNIDLGAYEHDYAETPAPGWVTGLKVVGTGHQSIDLEWTAPSDEDLAYYIVYASETNGFVPSLADSLTQTSGTETSFTVSGLTNGVTYYFRVAAVDADGWIGVGSAQAEGVPNYLGPWYVATDGNDSNEGSEGNPFRNLKKALEIAVDGDSILIKAGTYSGNNNINIMSDELTNGIVIKSVDGPGLAVFDAQSMGTPHMHFEHNQDTTFKVIGLKFINGYTPAIDNSQPWFNDGWNYGDYPIAKGFGGSIVIGNQNNYSGASPQFIDCIFEGNHSERMGGAVAIAIGSPVFKNVTFKDNQAGSGGAVFVSDPWDSATRNATFINCSFENNIAFSSLNDWMMGTGGAVNIGYNDNLSDQFLFEGCIFIGNLAEQSLNDGSFVRANGGAITTHSNIKVVNSLFDGNVARSTKSAAGGAVNIDINMNNNGGTGVFINNTFVNNHIEGVEEEFSPAVHFSSFSDNSPSAYTFFNNIVYGNTTTNFSSTPVDIHWGSAGYNMSTDFNLIEGIGGHSIFDQPNTISNLGPSFNDFANGDYTLNQFSPALEAGTANFNGYDAPSNDITGGQRALPPGSNPDLGAYEAGPAMHVAMTLDSVEVGSEDMIEVAKGDSATLALTIQSWDDPPIPAEDGTKINWFVFPENLQGVTPLKEDTVTTGGLAAVKFKIEDTAQSGQGFVIYAEVDNKFTVMGPKIFVDQIVTDPPPAPENLTASPDYWTSGDIFTLTWNSTDWINGIKGANVSINGSTPNYHPIDNVAPSVTGSVSQTGVCEVRVWLVDNLDNQSESNASITYIRRDVNPPSSITWASPGGWIKSNDVEFSWSGAGDDYGLEGYEIVLGTGNYEDASKQEIEGFYLDGSSTSWTYSGNLPSNLTWFTVTAYDSAGNFGGIFWQNLQIDDSPPNVWHNSPGEFVQEGQNANLNVQWDDSQSGINVVQIHIRPGDQDWYSSGDIANGGFNGIPGQDIYTAGVEYYIEAFDNAGNRGRDPQNEGETYTIRVQTNQYSSYDYYPSGMHSGTTVSDYSIVSVPLERNNTSMNTVFSEFGGTNNTQWRLYGWNGSSYYENPSSINPGEGYFLITSQANRNINTGQGTSFPLNQQFDIPVTPNQWNFIGNPYDFPVPLNALHLNNGGDIYSEGTYYFFLGDWDGSPSELNPFEGLIFKPTTATSIQIFPWEFANTAKQSTSNKNLLDEELTEGEWQVQVDVSNRVASDKLNIMGARQESTPYFDNVDAFEPPVAPGGIGMSIRSKVNEETIDKLAIDMRPITEDGHYWDLEVNSSIKNENVELTFNEMETIPDNFEAFIVDVDLNIAQNLKWKNTYRYLAEASGRTHNLRLLVGDKEFVEKNNAGVALYPDEYALGQNFPNPFNPRTSMILGMKDEGFVDLAIYNILGQEVRRFASNEFRPAGYYNITWNGLNQNREKVATGTYLVVASVKDASGKVKLQQVRKMLLLK